MKKQTYDLEERLLIKKSELLNDILEETEIAVECHAAQAPALRVGIGYLFFIRRSSFNVTFEP
ncbi:MAG: hypothetical protein LWX01_08005 [Deltaproteobacteria bacterium]|nr:hypothetical protein [Deltaproteobacteria bacterium]MDL1961627.1 hypothetical protein [Deltaproteobacteria bacterium]